MTCTRAGRDRSSTHLRSLPQIPLLKRFHQTQHVHAIVPCAARMWHPTNIAFECQQTFIINVELSTSTCQQAFGCCASVEPSHRDVQYVLMIQQLTTHCSIVIALLCLLTLLLCNWTWCTVCATGVRILIPFTSSGRWSLRELQCWEHLAFDQAIGSIQRTTPAMFRVDHTFTVWVVIATGVS